MYMGHAWAMGDVKMLKTHECVATDTILSKNFFLNTTAG
jgi:hypothetical protein